MRVIGTSALGLGLAGCIFGACTGSSPASVPGSADGGVLFNNEEAGADASIPGTDASVDAPADAPQDGMTDAPAVDAAPYPFTVVSTIALAGSPSAIAFNPVTNVLYVALAGTGGIVLIDGATNTVAATILSGDAAVPYPFVQMAVDFESNTVFAADSNPAGQTLYVIDGVTNAVTTTIPIGSALGMQVDSTAHRVYVLGAGTPAIPDGGTTAVSPATITVIDDATDDAGAPVVLGDQAISPGSGIALDPILNRLYVCGPNAAQYSSGTTNAAAVDTLDTATALTPAGAQQSFSGGGAIACLAGWGGGALVTAASAAVDFLGAPPLALTAGFVPTAAAGGGAVAPEKANVVVFGSSTSPSALEVTAVTENTDGGVSISLPPTLAVTDAGATAWRAVAVASASGGIVQAYLTYATTSDGGAAPSIMYASILTQ